MPASDRLFIEESTGSLIPLSRLCFFLKPFFSPYKGSIVLTIILAMGVIASELTLPQLFKYALDGSITAFARKIDLTDTVRMPEALPESVRGSLISAGGENIFFILPEHLKSLDAQVINRLETSGILTQNRYYAAAADSTTSRIADSHPSLFTKTDRFVLIDRTSLSLLSRNELTQLRTQDIHTVALISAVFLSVLAAGFVLNFLQIYIVEYTSQRIMHDIRLTVFGHVQTRAMTFFVRNPIGRLVTRVTNDIQNLHEMFNALFANIAKDLMVILGIMLVLLYVNWRLCLACFCILPLLILCSYFFSKASRRAFREVRMKIAALNAQIQENIAGIAVIKAFCREALNRKKFGQLNRENYRANMKQTLVFALFNPVVDLSRTVAIALIIWYGGGKVLQQAVTLGTLVLFLYYMRLFFRPIQDLAEKYNIIQSALASLERLYLLMRDTTALPAVSNPLSPDRFRGSIEFSHVTFGYSPDEPVLRDVSFRISPGETVAVVGMTGAGKSTIINLLERFYDGYDGTIRIDNIDIADIPASCIRRHIGLVMQDVFLFAGTVRHNIALDNDTASDDQINAVLNKVNAHHFVNRLPRNLYAEVAEGGKSFSAGERQLLSMARVVLKDPAILILDEATAYIDPVTEQYIQDAIDTIMQGRTSLIIAHRFSTIRKADRIIVLHRGRIYEQGTHSELLAKKGLYHKLYTLQYMS